MTAPATPLAITDRYNPGPCAPARVTFAMSDGGSVTLPAESDLALEYGRARFDDPGDEAPEFPDGEFGAPFAEPQPELGERYSDAEIDDMVASYLERLRDREEIDAAEVY